MAVIETQNLRKDYGRLAALKGVSLAVERGQVYGLLGQNGAGKTTLIKILLGITRPTGGGAKLLGEPAGRVEVRRRVGYLPEDHQFPGYHTGYSLLDFSAAMYGVPRADRRRLIPEMLSLVRIASATHKKIKGYSKGMKQRLGIAQAILHNPEVIFLDEPTDGVDPVGRREIRELMTRLREKGHTVFLNSHLLGEVEQVCDRVAILRDGELVREGTVADLTERKGRYELRLAPGEVLPEAGVRELGFEVAKAGDGWQVTLPAGATVDPVVRLLAAAGLRLRHLVERRASLEDVFMAVAAGEGKAGAGR
ncbi:MAG: ABC transporter ATP-binding protein [Isosphaera sp.]|nr:ABC transporter ATP-binding protein [Isosphaera sp.]